MALGVVSTFIISSCKKDANNISVKPTDDQKIAVLKQLGYKTDNIVDRGNYFIVEGDIILFKNADIFKDASKLPAITGSLKESPVKPIDQARTDYLVIQSSISVYIDSSIPSDGSKNDWHTGIANALSYWNAIPNSRINFSLSSSPTADIVIKSDSGVLDTYAGNNVLAAAMFPSTSNAPGDLIILNFNFYGNTSLTDAQKAYNIAHEIGHTLGLRHTNWDTRGESTYGTDYIGPYTYYAAGANLIAGTRNSADGASVMNGGTALNSWNGFSGFDILAVRTIYPLDASQKPIYRYGSGSRHFYSSYWNELGLGGAGYTYEGPSGYLYNYQATGTVPYYRYFNSSNGDHLYSQGSPAPSGYHLESILGYVYPTQVTGTIPLYRYYSSSAGHFYTLSLAEGSASGFTYEGISCYVIQ